VRRGQAAGATEGAQGGGAHPAVGIGHERPDGGDVALVAGERRSASAGYGVG
jgi:hypothetical protein